MTRLDCRAIEPTERGLLTALAADDASALEQRLGDAPMLLVLDHLGGWNWCLPRWLEWLPHLEHGEKLEPVEVPPAVPVPTA